MELTFDICTFKTVWEPLPMPEVVTLQDLLVALSRFEVKPKVMPKIRREHDRIDRAYEAWQAGKKVPGPNYRKLVRAAEEAKSAGEDVAEAVAARFEKLKLDTSRNAKKELRLWSPTLYAPGTVKRGSDNVVHLSCLVLDYDDGTTIAEASEVWQAYFHVVHSTWSHTPEVPKFRLILPMAGPVRAAEWADVWAWAEKRTGPVIDPSCKGVARAYALPATPHRDAPRVAFSHGGGIFDPLIEGIIDSYSTAKLGPFEKPEAPFVEGRPDVHYIDEGPGADAKKRAPPSEVHVIEPPDLDFDADDDDVWDGLGPGEDQRPLIRSPQTTTSTELSPDIAALCQRLDRLLDHWDRRNEPVEASGVAIVEALDRLVAMLDRGLLSKEEFDSTKARLLRPDED